MEEIFASFVGKHASHFVPFSDVGTGDFESSVEDSQGSETHGVGVLLVGGVEEGNEDSDEFGGGWGAVRSEDGWDGEGGRGGDIVGGGEVWIDWENHR